jgi:hypothetical protein
LQILFAVNIKVTGFQTLLKAVLLRDTIDSEERAAYIFEI